MPLAVARHRFAERMAERHPVHPERLGGFSGDWALRSRSAEPLGFGIVHRVDTTRPVDIPTLLASLTTTHLRWPRSKRALTPDPAMAKAPDLVGRDSTATEANTKYVGDITYLPLDGGKFLYLATVIDLASRRLTNWALADRMRTDLVTDALAAAERCRGSLAERSCTPTTAPRADSTDRRNTS